MMAAVDGYQTTKRMASYAHGPVLAMNPWFADRVLERVLMSSVLCRPSPISSTKSVARSLG